MPEESKVVSKVISTQLWSQEKILPKKVVIRKTINSAVYVEKEKPYMPPTRKTSPLSITSNDEGYISTTDRTTRTRPLISKRTISTDRNVSSGRTITNRRASSMDKSVKRCTCISSPNILCQCHQSDRFESNNASSDFWELNSASSSSSTESQITVKTQSTGEVPPINLNPDNMSLNSLSTDRTVDIDPREKEERIQEWLKKKEEEKKRKKHDEERVKRQKEKERQIQMEQKKEAHKDWLEKKKQQEEKLRKAKEKADAHKKKEEEEKLRKQSEGEQMFQAWLKIKKKEELEKKLNQKMKELKEYESKKKRLVENQEAFLEWVKNSKHKPRPVPLNNGLASLCSSPSVTYVNPEPWVGNLEPKSTVQVQTTFRERQSSSRVIKARYMAK